MIKKMAIISLAALAVAGCTTTERRAGTGALIGGGAGAIIGGIAGGGTGAAIGAGVGAASGAVIGAATAPRECWTRDRWGNRVAVRC
ncbi:glycine zipper domain-containing protein [Ancylobacter sp. G4_0304]|uniref:glycine zipper domain-containing protein n=1 Tax=Ancylobacter sp. G4_0304 TaxID=3114289 RepID=UPI0039C5FC19